MTDRPRTSRPRGLIAALALAAAIFPPAAAPGSAAYSYAELSIDGAIRAKTFQVVAEAIHRQDTDDPVGAPAAPDPTSSTTFSGRVNICIIATSEVQSGRNRTTIREKSCPRSITGYRYDASTFEASIVGVAKTQLWTQVWKNIGGLWRVVKDTTKPSTAKIALTWRWSETPRWGFGSCGLLTDAATGLAGPASIRGSIRFRGAGFTAKVPAGTPGYLFVGGCASPA